MGISRLINHLLLPDWWVMLTFPKSAQTEVEKAISRSEALHLGELRFVVEAGLPIDSLWSGQSPRDRAVDVFSKLKVWDTEYNSGVLIYLQLTDRQVEIIADRGINDRVGQQFWTRICRDMEVEFRAGHFEAGVITAIEAITQELTRYFPVTGIRQNELPDQVVVL